MSVIDALRLQQRSLKRLYANMADSHPKLARGRVWCRTCGCTLTVNSAECLRRGWPICCGSTMTIDAPAERGEGDPHE